MNTNEYIEKYTTIKKTKQQVIVKMVVPPRKVAKKKLGFLRKRHLLKKEQKQKLPTRNKCPTFPTRN